MASVDPLAQQGHPLSATLTRTSAVAIIQPLFMEYATTTTSFRHWLIHCPPAERRVVAVHWGIPAEQLDTPPEEISAYLLSATAVERFCAGLNAAERTALAFILAAGGSVPAGRFERRFGPLRVPAHAWQSRHYLQALSGPYSTTEQLFLAGVIHIQQFGWRRMYSVPADLRAVLPPAAPLPGAELQVQSGVEPPATHATDPRELEQSVVTILSLAQAGDLVFVADRGINKASMLRLARRWGMQKDDLSGVTYEFHWGYLHFLRLMLQGAGLLRIAADQTLRPTPAAGEWLQLPRIERLHRLLEGWFASDYEELKRLLGVEIKGYAPDYEPQTTRRAIVRFLSQTPPGEWIHFANFLPAVQQADADFLRLDGDYESWRLVDYRSLPRDGYEQWFTVEGELLKATIFGCLRWLGLVDYGAGAAAADGSRPPVAFRLNAYGAAVLGLAKPPPEEYAPLVVQGTFEVIAPPEAAPYHRFQIERIARLTRNGQYGEATTYKLTQASVHAAVEQGIDSAAITRFLAEASGAALPPNVSYTLNEWAGKHGQLTVRRGVLLQADDALLLERIKRDRRIRMPPVDQLSPTSWFLGDKDAARLGEALRRSGYGLAGDIAAESPGLKERDLTVIAAALYFYAHAGQHLGFADDVSNALLQRIDRLLTERQRKTAHHSANNALARLEEEIRDLID